MNTQNPVIESENSDLTEMAYAYCQRLAEEHYENFPVGSVLIPKRLRKHVYSIYAFARTADDFADEGYDGARTSLSATGARTSLSATGARTSLSATPTESERLVALNDWQHKLESCYDGRADHPIFIALSETVRELDLPIKLFSDLLSAFKQDVVKRRYANFEEVLDYCRRSANPVGRLILLLFGYRDENLMELSDHICTALQLANFWQDVSVDIRKDRIYLPQDEMQKFGVTVEDLRENKFSERYASLLKFQVERTWQLFDQGRPLPEMVSGRLKYELRLTWLGGTRILQLIEKLGYDTLNHRPVISSLDKLVLLAKMISG